MPYRNSEPLPMIGKSNLFQPETNSKKIKFLPKFNIKRKDTDKFPFRKSVIVKFPT